MLYVACFLECIIQHARLAARLYDLDCHGVLVGFVLKQAKKKGGLCVCMEMCVCLREQRDRETERQREFACVCVRVCVCVCVSE